MAIHAEARALAEKINKKEGPDTVFLASEMRKGPTFTSGSLAIDLILGGGWPANRWSEVIGMESHGKTAITLKTIAANQKRDPDFTTLWVAAEPYDFEQAAALGVNNEQVVLEETQDMVLAYETMLDFASSRAADCIVLDSYPALIAPEEDEKAMDEAVVALGARMTGKFFRKAGPASKRRFNDDDDRPMFGIIINQWRDKIGSWSPQGTPRTTPGGNGKNFSYYIRVDVSRDEWIQESIPGTEGKVKVGQRIKVKTVKNKQAPPQQTALVDFYFRDAPNHGFQRGDYDKVLELAIMSRVYNVIQRRGSRYYFGDSVWQGKDVVFNAIRDDTALQSQVEQAIREAALKATEPPTSEAEVEAVASEGKRTVRRRSNE